MINFSNDKLEVSFKSTYDPSTRDTRLPLTVDLRSTIYPYRSNLLSIHCNTFLVRRYIVRSGVPGFYCYAVCERPEGCPAFDLAQARMVFKLQRDR